MGGVDVEAVEDIIRDWLVLASGLSDDRVRIHDMVGPRPPVKPYLTLKLSDIRRPNWDAVIPPSEAGGKSTRRGDRLLEVTVRAYGKGAMALLSRVQSDVQTSQAPDDLGPISYLSDQGILDVTDLLDTEREIRAEMSMVLAVGVRFDDRLAEQDGAMATTVDAVLLGHDLETIGGDTGGSALDNTEDPDQVGTPSGA